VFRLDEKKRLALKRNFVPSGGKNAVTYGCAGLCVCVGKLNRVRTKKQVPVLRNTYSFPRLECIDSENESKLELLLQKEFSKVGRVVCFG
jgi:hypothetical protein